MAGLDPAIFRDAPKWKMPASSAGMLSVLLRDYQSFAVTETPSTSTAAPGLAGSSVISC